MSHYTRYVLNLEVLLSRGAAPKETSYLLRSGVSLTLQQGIIYRYKRGAKHPLSCNYCLRSVCDLGIQWQTAHLPSYALCRCITPKDEQITTLHTPWNTPSVTRARNSSAHAHIHLRILTMRRSEAEILNSFKTSMELSRPWTFHLSPILPCYQMSPGTNYRQAEFKETQLDQKWPPKCGKYGKNYFQSKQNKIHKKKLLKYVAITEIWPFHLLVAIIGTWQ